MGSSWDRPFESIFYKTSIYLASPGVAASRVFSCSMWDPVHRSGIEPWAPALECGVLTTGPPGKPLKSILDSSY